MVKTLIVASKVKELAKINGKTLNVSSRLNTALTKKVEKIIESACKRCVLNHRTTVMPKDL